MEKKLKVLVADDIEILAKNMSSIISENERVENVKYVLNGEDEIKQILSFQPDIVFTDMQMPKKTGLEVIEEIKSNNYIEKKPQFILVTADRDSSLVIKAREISFYIEYKSISAERINEYINNLGIETPKKFMKFKKKKQGFFNRIF